MSTIMTRSVEYTHDDVLLEGFMASPSAPQARPAVLLVHEWGGIGAHVQARARQIAERLGYHALAVDVYGKGVRPTSREACAETMMLYVNDRDLLRARLQAALEWVRMQPDVESGSIAIAGYCFGGLAAMELARSGADILLAASFHGNLSTRDPAEAKQISCPVVAFHGAADPLVTQDVVAGFEQEMSAAGVDWTVVQFGGVMHSFTNPDANDPDFGTVYNAQAAERSFAMFGQYLAAAFDEANKVS
ncbi:dienelactone hydrolase family protein [Plasticicumulans acidivorans]|uniref:Dienelactone hydrolase n=1 Tax=Plasticicumulans acidivorans TaxID=886464 RepID=A0A317MYF8_9GAMM|nr:dienelactone hydrolase family protein [Plasticicumulans acidivorans]PWV64663.1 dienelactone hydrolase [Plasticicumulans acidivorans]